MWFVWDSEDGMVYIGDDENEANKNYESYKKQQEENVNLDGFLGDERVIIGRITKYFKAFNTKIPSSEDQNVTYWDFSEKHYKE